MASTTTNYGWTVPTSSDLVKNGATAISTVGQSVDTFLFRPFTRNALLNSGFNVWQRGTSFSASNSAATSYWTDRWSMYFGTTTGYTLSRQSVNDSTNLPNIQYCARIARANGTTGSTGGTIGQSIEILNSVPYAGKSVTLSFYARKGADYSGSGSTITATLKSGTGSSDANGIYNTYTGQATVVTVAATLTTTWQRFTVSGTVASTATQLALAIDSAHTGTSGVNDYYEITGIMVETGSQASPYCPATPTYATELAACQRYYYRTSPTASGMPATGGGGILTTTIGQVFNPFPVTMRTNPTAMDYSAINWYNFGNNTEYNTGTFTMTTATPNFASVRYTHGSIIFVAGQAGAFTTAGASSYLGFTAEL
jgi:hypothetical protein